MWYEAHGAFKSIVAANVPSGKVATPAKLSLDAGFEHWQFVLPFTK